MQIGEVVLVLEPGENVNKWYEPYVVTYVSAPWENPGSMVTIAPAQLRYNDHGHVGHVRRKSDKIDDLRSFPLASDKLIFLVDRLWRYDGELEKK